MAMKSKKPVPAPQMTTEYEILDPDAGDVANELGGVKIYSRSGKRYVRMFEEQAKWFLEHGTITLPAN